MSKKKDSTQLYVARLLESVRVKRIAIQERRQARLKEHDKEETWSVHPLEWINKRHVAKCSAEVKNCYMEKWLKECNQIRSDDVPDQKAGNEYNDGKENANGQSSDCAMTDDDEEDEDEEGSEDSDEEDDDEDDEDDDSDEEDDDEDEEGSEDLDEEDDDEDDEDDDSDEEDDDEDEEGSEDLDEEDDDSDDKDNGSDEEDNDEDENDSEEKERPKAKRQRPMENGKIEQKMKKAKKEEHEDEKSEDKESAEKYYAHCSTDRPPDENTKG